MKLPQLVDVDRQAPAVDGDDEPEADRDLTGRDDHHHQREDLPAHVAVGARERDHRQIGGVQHQLQAEQDHERVAPGEDARDADAEDEDGEDEEPGDVHYDTEGLTDDSQSGVTQIRSVGCSTKHDGQVLSTGSLTADEAASYGETSPVAICTPSVTEAGNVDLLADPELVLIALTQDSSPASGDKLVCVIANADGSKLTSKLGS